jgi:regulator of sigma E protease
VPLLLGFVGLALVIAGHLVAQAAARVAMARALGVRPTRMGMAVVDEASWRAAKPFTRRAVVGAGPLGSYAWAALLFMVGALVGGRDEVDAASLRVKVAPGGPADVAGMHDGDRVVRVDGADIRDWDDLRRAVQSRSRETIDVEIDRDGHPLHLTPAVPASGRILVGPETRHVDVGLGQAFVQGIVGPFAVVGAAAKAFYRTFAGHEKTEFSGPVGIAREVGGSRGEGNMLRLLAVLAAYFLPFTLLLMLVPAARIVRRPPG